MKKLKLLLSFAFCLLLASCVSGWLLPAKNTQVSMESATNTPFPTESAVLSPASGLSDCLSPIENFEYQIGDAPSDFDWSVVNNKVLSSQEWQKTITIPDASRLMLVQSRNDETVFWIDLHSGGFIRYRVSGNKWGDGGLLLGPADDLRGFPLFLDQKNNVFGARYNNLDHGDTEALLNRYNEQTNQWEPMILDLANQDKLGIAHVAVDEQGKFWLLVRSGTEYQLYSLDPQNMATKRHLAEYTLVSTSFTVALNKIFILALSKDATSRYLLLQYPLDGGDVQTEYVGAPIYYDYGRIGSTTLPDKAIFVDSQQRVWIGGRGWLDLSTDEWHYVIPDPVFITVLAGAGRWVWGEPELTAETPDGRLWYNSLRGTGWVDLKLGKWCVFTNYQSNVLPDKYGNLWLVAGDGLYRHK
jgi:hypothetical protein